MFAGHDMKIPEFKNKNRMIDAGKNVLIVILMITAALLAVKSGLFSGRGAPNVLDGVLPFGQETPLSGENGIYTAAAAPFYIVVTPQKGAHCAVVYDGEAVRAAYSRFSALLGQAIGSSGEPEAATDGEWKTALSGSGIYFDFLSDQPLSVLAGWLGTSVSGGAADHTARRICIAADGSGVTLYYIRARYGTVYRCKTALSNTDISDNIAGYLPDGTAFNFELASPFLMVDGNALITTGRLDIHSATAENPLNSTAGVDGLLSAFEMNSVLAEYVQLTDGTELYVEGDATMRIEANGTVMYSDTGQQGQEDVPTPAQAIEMARALCQKTIGADCGAASVYLSSIWKDSEAGEYQITFDYSLNGLPITFSDGSSAAELTLTGSGVTSAKMILRKYRILDDSENPLPAMQAAAVVQAMGGGEPVLSYTDDYGSVAVNWVVR
ncbi:MAG TPA: hypothetical protein DD735_10370 [Clostridiales bacterium]|nr:hypothetical protein [Clostridiales bacterium]